jgi:TPR repeat protein
MIPVLKCLLASHYQHGNGGLQQDEGRAMELWTQAAKLGSSDVLCHLVINYDERGDLKKAKFHHEAATMAGQPCMEYESGNMEQAVKHSIIAASAGHYDAMSSLKIEFGKRHVSRDAIDSTLIAYNTSCSEMRSEVRDA